MSGDLETEIKLRVQDADTGRKLLESHGFRIERARIFEANCVYDLPGGELRKRGELLRLRLAGDRAVLTWKGPELPGRHKSRPETEVGVLDFAVCGKLLQDLGYTLVFRYEKYRTEYRQDSTTGVATLDETPIGVFLELEGEAGWIDRTATDLGFTSGEYVLASYGRLYQQFCDSRRIQPGFMLLPEDNKS